MNKRSVQQQDWQEKYKDRISSAAAAMKLIKPGNNIFIGTGCAQPQHLVAALMEHAGNLYDCRIIQISTFGTAPYADPKYRDRFKLSAFFISENIRETINSGNGDYTPIHLSEVPQEFEEGRMPIDVALIMVSPPDARGQCSLGVSVDIVKAAAASAKYVVAQVNPAMPYTHGNSLIHVNQLDTLVPFEQPLIEVPVPRLDDRLRKIGLNVAHLVEDGSTIECGIGNVSQAVGEFLKGKKDLGIHTELLSDWIIDLVEAGVVTSNKKTINRGKVVASFAAGSKRLYDFINNNPVIEMHPTEYVNDPFVISQHDKMVAINVGLEIDLTGQVVADSIGSQFYSGVGGQVDFFRGAARSRGGKAILAMPSTAKNDTISRILPQLSPSAGVVTSRADIHYVVTEYGIAYLHGKSIRERALALISVAHPKFRKELIQAAKQMKYIYEDQIEIAWDTVRYPEELERNESLRDGTQILLRPVKPTDEPLLSGMLYSLSSDSVHNRFFTYTMAFPHKNVQQLTNIDYLQNLAIVGVVPGPSEDQIVAIGQYFLDPKTQAAEIAFVVQDDWQAKGMGSLLMKYISEIAIARGVKRFDAKVIPSNKAMLTVFQNSGLPYRSEFDGESYSITFDLEKAKADRAKPLA